MATETETTRSLLETYKGRLQLLLDQAAASGGIELLSLINFNSLIDAQDRIISYSQELGIPSGIAQSEVDKLAPYLPTAINLVPKITNEDLLDHLNRLELIHRRNLGHLYRQKSILESRGQYSGSLETDIDFELKALKEVQESLYQ